ncbi:hypothetical protein niasHS_015715 [Heterodera schachtii]|uniref:B box-type domain-containing protein n=1 Tax=Heterodera schachtii TaxID=97005 RepID=A0ABD2HW52_HETSC
MPIIHQQKKQEVVDSDDDSTTSFSSSYSSSSSSSSSSTECQSPLLKLGGRTLFNKPTICRKGTPISANGTAFADQQNKICVRVDLDKCSFIGQKTTMSSIPIHLTVCAKHKDNYSRFCLKCDEILCEKCQESGDCCEHDSVPMSFEMGRLWIKSAEQQFERAQAAIPKREKLLKLSSEKCRQKIEDVFVIYGKVMNEVKEQLLAKLDTAREEQVRLNDKVAMEMSFFEWTIKNQKAKFELGKSEEVEKCRELCFARHTLNWLIHSLPEINSKIELDFDSRAEAKFSKKLKAIVGTIKSRSSELVPDDDHPSLSEDGEQLQLSSSTSSSTPPYFIAAASSSAVKNLSASASNLCGVQKPITPIKIIKRTHSESLVDSAPQAKRANQGRSNELPEDDDHPTLPKKGPSAELPEDNDHPTLPKKGPSAELPEDDDHPSLPKKGPSAELPEDDDHPSLPKKVLSADKDRLLEDEQQNLSSSSQFTTVTDSSAAFPHLSGSVSNLGGVSTAIPRGIQVQTHALANLSRQSSLTDSTTALSASKSTAVSMPNEFSATKMHIEELVARGANTWTVEEVSSWANFVTGSDKIGDRFAEEEVNGASLLCLQYEELKTELKIKFGPSKMIWNSLEALKRK